MLMEPWTATKKKLYHTRSLAGPLSNGRLSRVLRTLDRKLFTLPPYVMSNVPYVSNDDQLGLCYLLREVRQYC